MPDNTPVDPAPILAHAAMLTSSSLRALARETGVSDFTVRKALARFEPVRETLSQIKREELIAAWQTVGIKALAAADEILDGPKERGWGKDLQANGIFAGIATEKSLLLAGQPTQITQVTTDLRASLPGLLERLGRIGRTRVEALGPGGPAHEAAEMDDRALTPEETR